MDFGSSQEVREDIQIVLNSVSIFRIDGKNLLILIRLDCVEYVGGLV